MQSCEKTVVTVESSKVSVRTIVKRCCRVCGKAVEQKKKKQNRKALFAVVGLRDRITERLSHLSGLTVTKEDLSEFACKKVFTNLDKLTRMPTQSVHAVRSPSLYVGASSAWQSHEYYFR